jgi:hypothetical protein
MKAVARDTLVKLEVHSDVLQAMCVRIAGWSLMLIDPFVPIASLAPPPCIA